MPARRVSNSDAPKNRRPPATTPEARENQLIAAAMDLAEKQIQEGTASAQVITHFLKLGSPREKLERERLSNEVQLMEAKKEQLASQARVEELYEGAILAMRSYTGASPEMEEDYED